jgi:hypothetical protein
VSWGQVLGAGVVFEQERDVAFVLRPDAEPSAKAVRHARPGPSATVGRRPVNHYGTKALLHWRAYLPTSCYRPRYLVTWRRRSVSMDRQRSMSITVPVPTRPMPRLRPQLR